MSNTKLLIIGGAGVVAVLILVFVLIFSGSGGSSTPTNVTLQFWGVFDNKSFYSKIFNDFQKENPGVKIVYRDFNPQDYEKELISSFAAGTGPDIWLMHNTWLPKHADKIAPLTDNIKNGKVPLLTYKDFKSQFVDVAESDLTSGGVIYALPTYVDTLALYYNKDIFNSAGVANPPTTWEEFNNDVKKTTLTDSSGNITRSGAAVGTSRNINRSTDILMLLMMQSGTPMTDQNGNATFAKNVDGKDLGETALQYYTDFANPSKEVYTWNSRQHYSVDAFSEGNLAIMINYSHQIDAIRAKAPRLNFSIAPMPQISGSSFKLNYASYWAPTVSKQSKNQAVAWKFLVYLSSKDGVTPYINAAGRSTARRDLIEIQREALDLGIFAEQALTAASWYQVDESAIATIFAEMIDDVYYGRASARDAVRSAENKVNVLKSKNNGQGF